MNPDTTQVSLEELHDIVLPAAVSWMPATSAWWILLAVARGARHLGWALRRLPATPGKPLPPRGARRPGAGSRRRSPTPSSDRFALAALPVLVKRTALASHPRAEIASLSTQSWLQFLDASYDGRGFSEGPGYLLSTLAYASPATGPEDRRWRAGCTDLARPHVDPEAPCSSLTSSGPSCCCRRRSSPGGCYRPIASARSRCGFPSSKQIAAAAGVTPSTGGVEHRRNILQWILAPLAWLLPGDRTRPPTVRGAADREDRVRARSHAGHRPLRLDGHARHAGFPRGRESTVWTR